MKFYDCKTFLPNEVSNWIANNPMIISLIFAMIFTISSYKDANAQSDGVKPNIPTPLTCNTGLVVEEEEASLPLETNGPTEQMSWKLNLPLIASFEISNETPAEIISRIHEALRRYTSSTTELTVRATPQFLSQQILDYLRILDDVSKFIVQTKERYGMSAPEYSPQVFISFDQDALSPYTIVGDNNGRPYINIVLPPETDSINQATGASNEFAMTFAAIAPVLNNGFANHALKEALSNVTTIAYLLEKLQKGEITPQQYRDAIKPYWQDNTAHYFQGPSGTNAGTAANLAKILRAGLGVEPSQFSLPAHFSESAAREIVRYIFNNFCYTPDGLMSEALAYAWNQWHMSHLDEATRAMVDQGLLDLSTSLPNGNYRIVHGGFAEGKPWIHFFAANVSTVSGGQTISEIPVQLQSIRFNYDDGTSQTILDNDRRIIAVYDSGTGDHGWYFDEDQGARLIISATIQVRELINGQWIITSYVISWNLTL